MHTVESLSFGKRITYIFYSLLLNGGLMCTVGQEADLRVSESLMEIVENVVCSSIPLTGFVHCIHFIHHKQIIFDKHVFSIIQCRFVSTVWGGKEHMRLSLKHTHKERVRVGLILSFHVTQFLPTIHLNH